MLLSMSSKTQDLPMHSYYTYIGALDWLALLADSEIDVAALPSARELALPSDTQVGFGVGFGQGRLSATLSYQSTPLDAVSGSNTMTTVAISAILAAIALPAYQDYVTRSQVSIALAAASSAKLELAESYYSEGAFPEEQSFDSGVPHVVLSWQDQMLL